MDIYVNGIGACLPTRVVTNEVVSVLAGLNPEWIYERTGIKQRYLSPSEESAKHLATIAAREALIQAEMKGEEIGIVIAVSTFHGSIPFASTADAIKRKLDLRNAQVVDICTPRTGFMDALKLGINAINAEETTSVLVIGVEGFSEATKLKDRRACYLFSDGAGAVVFSRRKGFARLGQIRTGNVASNSPIGPEVKDQEPFSFYEQNSSGLIETLLTAIEVSLSFDKGDGINHIITQDVRDMSLIKNLPAKTLIFNPFAETGHFLSASFPLLLNQLIKEKSCSVNDQCLLLSTDGRGLWTTCRLEMQDFPKCGKATEELLKDLNLSNYDTRGEISGKDVTTCSAEEAEKILVKEAGHTDPKWGSLVCLTLKLSYEGTQPEELRHHAGKEALFVLQNHIRSRDILLRLEDHLRYVLLLRYVHMEDVQRICERFKRVLEYLDPAGEISFYVDAQIFPFSIEKRPMDFAREVIEQLTR